MKNYAWVLVILLAVRSAGYRIAAPLQETP